ncbi:hypothetical protein GCM10023081_28560 [Arthrobacter ginkgonis]|uniref:DUF3099 domain-containing protein n=1 Tax=Arthrobacter ginkgonis TaxID=1630594 RepID=A0ABP7CH56_9MICC
MTQPAHSDRHRGTHGQPVHSITDADEARSAEQHSRIVKYTVSMSVRLACFIAAFFTSGWVQWTLLAGAVVLPYFAVIIANGGADRSKKVHSDALLDAPPRWALGPAPAGASGSGSADSGTADSGDWDSGVWSGGGDASASTAEPDAGASTDGSGTAGNGTTPVLLEGELVEDTQPDDGQADPPGSSGTTGPSSTAQGRP